MTLAPTLPFTTALPLSLPDVTAFGPYTYLVTELLWGAVALSLLAYADAWRAAARTIAVLYLPAYAWDRYTLAVGVFAIPMRTGVEVAGIPLEEHLFILVVPATVVGVHEALGRRVRGDDERRRGDGERRRGDGE